MVSYIDEQEALFDLYEELHLSEKEILNRSIELVIRHNFDADYMYDLNDTIFNRGYSFQFEVEDNKKEFDINEYNKLITNVTKSKDKTLKLIKYLDEINDHRLTFASLHMLKVKYLIDLNYLPSDNDIINSNLKLSFKELFFSYYDNKNLKKILVKTLSNIGIKYAECEYFDFIIDIEYLLYSIEENDPNYGYIKSNTLKVAFNITPKEYYEKDGKKYYNPKTSKVSKEYLKLINKDKIKKIKSKWLKDGYETVDTGHMLLYKLL